MDIHNSIGGIHNSIMNILIELCTNSMTNNGYPQFTTITDIHNCNMDIHN